MDRRQFLGLTGVSIVALLGGCSTDTSSNTPSADTATFTPTEAATPSDTATPERTSQEPNYPDTGSLSFSPAGGAPAEHALFDGDVALSQFADNPEDYEMPSMEELREIYHFKQVDRIADGLQGTVEGRDKEKSELLREFPRRLLDEDWRETNIFDPLAEKWGEEIEDWFKTDVYNSDASLLERYRKSNWNGLWTEIEGDIAGGVSSTRDYMKSAALAASEYFSAGNETFTSHMKTNGGNHGLGMIATNLTYNQGETSKQRIYGLETESSEQKQIWQLQEGYPTMIVKSQ